MRSRTKLPDRTGPFTKDEFDLIDQQYPNASDAEKYRLMQAQRLIGQHNRGSKPRQPARKRRR